MNSKTHYTQGWSDFVCFLEKINGILVNPKATAFTDATFIAEATHKENIASTTAASRITNVFQVVNYEKTTDDVTIQTSNLGYKTKDGDPVPSALLHINGTAKDYQTLKNMECQSYDVIFFDKSGRQVGYNKGINSKRGLRARVATVYDLPQSDNGQFSFAIHLFFDRPEEFKNLAIENPSYTFGDLKDYVPVGYNLKILTAYTAGDVVVKVTKRGETVGVTGLDGDDFEILESDATPTVAVTAANDDGLGQYTVTIKQDNGGTPANISSGKYYVLQAHADDGNFTTYLSNVEEETVS